MGILYTGLESVKSAMDMAETARADALVLRQIDAASRSIESLLNRRDGLAPKIATRYFDWPDCQQGASYRLWLDETPLLAVTSASSGGVTIASSDYFLEPQRYGPPYDRIELDLSSDADFGGGDTHQRDVTIAGTWGYADEEAAAGTLAAAVSTTTATTINVTESTIETGHLLRVGDERMQVTGRRMLTSGQTLGADLAASKAGAAVPVADGTAFNLGQAILVDTERMLVVDIAANTLIVRRAQDGSALAAHASGATIYEPNTLVVQRGVQGTTAATHSLGVAIARWVPPADVEQLCIDEAIWRLQNTLSGMARVVGDGDGARMVNARTISIEREDVFRAHGRIRKRVI